MPSGGASSTSKPAGPWSAGLLSRRRTASDFSAAREARLEFPAAKKDAAEHGRRFRDPHFTGEVIAMPKRRARYKKALAELVTWADGDQSDGSVLTKARELVAA